MMENLQDMLLEHAVPDQTGMLGKIQYNFSEMKIVQVHWPKVSSVDGLFVATNGALRLQGKYQLHRPGVLGYTKCGSFVFDLGAIYLSIKDSNSASSSQSSSGRRHANDRNQDVTCNVGHIKVKFHGGAAMICQLLTTMYIKMYRRHLEAQIASVILETIKDDRQLLVSALTVMAAMGGGGSESHINQSASSSSSASANHRHRHHSSSSDTTESPSRIQRFLDSFKRRPSAQT